jgi:Tfp pilus assembly protein PilV
MDRSLDLWKHIGAVRRGAVLVVVLVCLAVAAAMFVVLVKLAATGRQSMQTQCWRMQAQWLAESGLERAAARLAADAKYTNETWTISAEELGGDAAGVVRIRAEAVADRPNRRLVSVEADYPDDPQHRVRCNKQIVVDVHRTIGGTL